MPLAAMPTMLAAPPSFPGNKKIRYYYKLSEKEDLDDFSNTIFYGNYILQQIQYPISGAPFSKSVTVPVLSSNSAIVIDDEIEEGLYLIRIKVFNTSSNTIQIHPNFNSGSVNNDFDYNINPNSAFEIYDIFLKEKGSAYSISLPTGLALIEFSMERIFEKGNRINIPQNLVNYAYTFGPGVINFRLRKGTYVVKIPYSYTNFDTSAYSNQQIGNLSTSLGINIPLIISSIPANGSGSGQFVVYLKITGDYEDISINISYNINIQLTIGLEVEEINEFVLSTNFLSKTITLSGSQVVQNILNVQGSGTHLRLKYASVSGLSTAVSQCQLQAANLNRNSNYSVIWDFIAGGSATPPGWSVDEINAVQLVANGGTSATSVSLSLILLYEVVAGELS